VYFDYITRNVKAEYEKAGLAMNLSKTKYLYIYIYVYIYIYIYIGEQTGNLDLGNKRRVALCDNYKYLGMRIGKYGRDEERAKIFKAQKI
jgi:hypothetical protein